MDQFSYLSNGGIEFIESLYNDYRNNPESVDAGWRKFFEGFDFATTDYRTKLKPTAGAALAAGTAPDAVYKEINVLNLIAAYRQRGHLFADTNPIQPNPVFTPTLDIENFGLTAADLDTTFHAGTQLGIGAATLRNIIQVLKDTYCRSIGVEYMYVSNPERVAWLQRRMESIRNTPNYSPEDKRHILRKLGQATYFESFIHRKFVGQKRFSLEGAESLIPAMEACIEKGAELGVQEFVIGMAHRGRLNVLTNILRKEYDQVFGEFTGKGISDEVFDGDVKYHMGYSNDLQTRKGKIVHLSLAPNPSHLEAVNPVVQGVSRAKMDILYNNDNSRICPILIHGDASLSGQGIVYEVIQMYKLAGYEVGGTVHIVINNQVGFTTDPSDSRSSTYCTDVAKVTKSPVFHVNGDDIEAVTFVVELAMEYRQAFKQDVFIDIVCYRKYGHNEGDEPRFTQPKLYEAIGAKLTPYQVYVNKLKAEGSVEEKIVTELEKELNDYLNKELEESKVNQYQIAPNPRRLWDGIVYYDPIQLEANPDTRIKEDTLRFLAERITALPKNFNMHRTQAKLLEDRRKMVYETNSIDWGMAEHLAFASLLAEKYPVRITGQDVERGTFSHRHAVIKDQSTEARYLPLSNIGNDQAVFSIYNSLLSEFAVLGFELGYAMANPQALTIWEAQFGDFINGAQIIIDQFLSAMTTKWQRMTGVTLLLPHGYEGQGPEHSSARFERFLSLCAENNMYVCNFTSPANLFHALRRQVHSGTRRPLVVMTPKSLLRHPRCVSSLEEFTKQGLQEVIDDAQATAAKVKRVVLCTGKIYFDLLAQKEQQNLENVALVRVEQLYPYPEKQLQALVKKYNKAKDWVWAQEEPENMGGWSYMLRKFRDVNLEVVSRKESASPATGSNSLHLKQQEEIIRKALDLKPVTVTAVKA